MSTQVVSPPHVHPHPHRHTADGGPVVLDLGGDVGALVLLAEPSLAGAEIEISRVGSGVRQHVAVHPRVLAGSVVYAAVYPELVQGEYQLWTSRDEAALTVEIVGGGVTQARWPLPDA